MSQNPYLPRLAVIERITIENENKDLKTFTLKLTAQEDRGYFAYQCGQFAMLSVPHTGEIPIGIASSPLDEGCVEFTVKKYPTGSVTSTIHNLETGAKTGLRGAVWQWLSAQRGTREEYC